MGNTPARWPRRLIEVDLPIKRISSHASREKSIRHGHISTLHIWWARRPLAACRAVICAALWLDPVDRNCPQSFREAATGILCEFAEQVRSDPVLAELCFSTWSRWMRTNTASLKSGEPSCWPDLRYALLDFIADFANWKASCVPAFTHTAQALTEAANVALGGEPGTRPLVIDPFAGGGAIPLEALRVGADAFASDLNPVAVLLNKIALEYLPKYGPQLATDVRYWGAWIKERIKGELDEFYPPNQDGETPVAYLWARTIQCEGPACGVEVPLIRSQLLARRGANSIVLTLNPDAEKQRVNIDLASGRTAGSDQGTVRRGAVTCPVCGYTTPVERVRAQLKQLRGGVDASRLLAVVDRNADGKNYRLPTLMDVEAVERARRFADRGSILPSTELPLMSGVFNVPIYGMDRWDLLFSSRQLVSADAIGRGIDAAVREIQATRDNADLALALKVLLVLALDKYLDFRSSLCAWINVGEKIGHTFGRQALGMIFDWAEGVPFGDISGSWERSIEFIAEFLATEGKCGLNCGTVEQALAQNHPLPDSSAQAFVTDPPYYNAVPYADLSDFFYLWLKRRLDQDFPDLFGSSVAPKAAELCEMRGWDPIRYPEKGAAFYEAGMRSALSEGRRLCDASGIGVVIFAHKTTAGWESLLSALIDSGWVITASWPIDTERGGRLRAMNSAALASSIHLVCRPRVTEDPSSVAENVGDWRDVLVELPKRIHEWLPMLIQESVVGADAIFACIGPALEIYSKYSRVEKASGAEVRLAEYLEYVWAAVAKEALNTIFREADATGFEEDARLTAMWLWTISTGNGSAGVKETSGYAADEEAGDDSESGGKKAAPGGYTLEYDAARKIGQGLGAHLEKLGYVVEVKGGYARLLSVAERTRYLFGKEAGQTPVSRKQKQPLQLSLFAELVEAEEAAAHSVTGAPPAGATVLDRVHQAMILFGAGRSEALKRFLVEDGAGKEQSFWRLAQALSALYPAGSDEKRWVDGVLARKKSLGF
ncbi:MAG: DUF1156 domain-containing protein [Chloroflexi bacterium]|nr:DUF1156 domain-containing protein [Chloroflexota bacterium]